MAEKELVTIKIRKGTRNRFKQKALKESKKRNCYISMVELMDEISKTK